MHGYQLLSVTLLVVGLSSASTRTARQPTDAVDSVHIRRVPHGGIQPEVIVDWNGVLHMVYFAGPPMGGNLYYVRSANGGDTFSMPIRVNSQDNSAIATGTIRGAQLAIGREGRVHVGWNGSDAALPGGLPHPKTKRAGNPMLYARSTAAATSFDPQRNLMTRTVMLDGGGTIAADHDGRVYVAWHANAQDGSDSEANRRVWIARSQDDGVSFDQERPVWAEPTGACACCGLR